MLLDKLEKNAEVWKLCNSYSTGAHALQHREQRSRNSFFMMEKF